MQNLMQIRAGTLYHIEAWRPDIWSPDKATKAFLLENGIPTWGLLWEDDFTNTVVTEGLNELLNMTFKSGSQSATWYVGLKDTGSVNAGDTMSSHSSWSELSAIYSQGSRPEWVEGSVSGGSVSNTASKAEFSITSTDDVYGAFLTNNSSKGGTSGKLYGAGDFSGGARSVQSGDTLWVTVTCSVTTS